MRMCPSTSLGMRRSDTRFGLFELKKLIQDFVFLDYDSAVITRMRCEYKYDKFVFLFCLPLMYCKLIFTLSIIFLLDF